MSHEYFDKHNRNRLQCRGQTTHLYNGTHPDDFDVIHCDFGRRREFPYEYNKL